MKSIYKFLFTITILFWLASCSKMLDLQPITQLNDATVLTTTKGLQAALIGGYDKLKNGDLYGGRHWVSADMLAGTVKISGLQNTVFEELQILNKTMSGQSNRITQSVWEQSYQGIAIINRLLVALPTVNDFDMTDSERKRIEGEAKFLRALLYFPMVQYYSYNVTGKGPLSVPILTKPATIYDAPPRNTITEAFMQMAQDLKDAAALLKGANTNGRATDISAEALLSRVYFYKQDWDSCKIASDYVISQFAGKPNGGLGDSVLACFSKTPPPESLFTLLGSSADDVSGTLRSYYRFIANGKFVVDVGYIVKLTADGKNDVRASVVSTTKPYGMFNNVEGKVYTQKFDVEFLSIPIIRLAEVYLNRAEALVHINNNLPSLAAASDLNVVRNRSKVASLAGAATLADCLKERNIELSFEGDFFFNMKRLQVANFAKDINGTKYNWDDVKLVFPIPQTELNTNPSLVQNN